jgi:hypothetical protein
MRGCIRYDWGSIFFVPTSYDGDEETLHDVMLESHPRQTSSFAKARALWRIAGRDEKALKIDRIIDRALAPDRASTLRQADLLELGEALTGLEEALDEHAPWWKHTLQTEVLEELRENFPALDLEDAPGFLSNHDLRGSLEDAQELARLLSVARDRGLNVVVDFDR